MKKRKLTGFELVWYLGVFGFLLVWFTQIHPLVVYDADDWTYLAYVRSATPIWGDWNPAEVFPETVMPFFSTVAVYTLMPLLGDYILAQTVMHALGGQRFYHRLCVLFYRAGEACAACEDGGCGFCLRVVFAASFPDFPKPAAGQQLSVFLFRSELLL